MNTSKKTNTLTSHCPERTTNRADKMGGWYSKNWKGISKVFVKKFTSKKRRQLLKQNIENKI